MPSELKPCPWKCGKPVTIDRIFGSERYSLLHRCSVVGPVSFTDETREKCITAWNARPVEDTPVEALTVIATKGQTAEICWEIARAAIKQAGAQ